MKVLIVAVCDHCWVENGCLSLTIVLQDTDGKKLMNSDINIDFQPPQGALPEAAFSFALNGQNVIFSKPGDYGVEILIDGKLEAGLPLYVRETKNGQGIDIPDRI